MPDFFRTASGGVDVFVRLTPRGGADAIEGVEETADGRSHLKARVRVAPEKGAANKALEKLLAHALGIPKGEVSVASGATARLKTLRVTVDEGDIVRKLRALAASSGR